MPYSMAGWCDRIASYLLETNVGFGGDPFWDCLKGSQGKTIAFWVPHFGTYPNGFSIPFSGGLEQPGKNAFGRAKTLFPVHSEDPL